MRRRSVAVCVQKVGLLLQRVRLLGGQIRVVGEYEVQIGEYVVQREGILVVVHNWVGVGRVSVVACGLVIGGRQWCVGAASARAVRRLKQIGRV